VVKVTVEMGWETVGALSSAGSWLDNVVFVGGEGLRWEFCCACIFCMLVWWSILEAWENLKLVEG